MCIPRDTSKIQFLIEADKKKPRDMLQYGLPESNKKKLPNLIEFLSLLYAINKYKRIWGC